MAVYIVRNGDSLSAIAKKLNIPNWRTLYETNKAIIGANPNLIRPGQKLSYGADPVQATPQPVIPEVSPAVQMAQQAAAAQPINFGEVLPWEQYFSPELAKGSAEQAYSQYYTPLVQKAQEGLETEFAGRNLTRSGIRGAGVSDLYRQYGQEQQAGTEADYLQQQQMAREDYERMRQMYEDSSGKQKPTTTTWTPYKTSKPTTSAGTYGSSYLDWLNRVTRV